MEEGRPIIESTLSYSLVDSRKKQVAKGEGKGRLEKESLVVLPKFGETLLVPFRDIADVDAKNYKIHLTLSSNEKLTLFDLGRDYEDFLRVFTDLRNEVLRKDMLMHETLRKPDVEAGFAYTDESGKVQRGIGKVRLYETGLVFTPDRGDQFRIPYSDLAEISEKGLGVVLTTEFGEKLILSKMGRELDPFKRALSEIYNELQEKVQVSLKELIPSIDPTSLRVAARFMREGKAARRSDIESVSPKLWAELENKLESAGIKEGYDFLKSMAQEKKICIGLKRGLMGDLTGEYIWFLIPIYSTDSRKPGNAVAMEATSGEGSGMATYFFRIVSRKDYPNFKKIEDLHGAFDDFLKRINRCMLAVNFRREPIYLPDEKLREPRYQKYAFAIQKLPALRTLRSLFIGRVIHSSPGQWKKDVMDLLKFNVSAREDAVRWRATQT